MHSSLLPRMVSWHVLLGGDLTMLVKRSPYLAFPLTWPKQSDNRQEALTLEVFQPKKSETQTNFHDWIHFCFDQHLSFGSAAWRRLLATAVSPAGNNFSPSLSVCSCDATPLCKCEQVVGVTYCDDIQDAEEAVDTIPWENLLHHALFAILEARKNMSTMRKN